jgi:cGMP-dependent protein kinase 1
VVANKLTETQLSFAL